MSADRSADRSCNSEEEADVSSVRPVDCMDGASSIGKLFSEFEGFPAAGLASGGGVASSSCFSLSLERYDFI